MAYKFQRGEANLSGAIELQSAAAELSLSQQDGAKKVEITQAGIVSASAQVRGGKLTIDADDVITAGREIQNVTTVSGSGLAQFGQARLDGGLTMQGSFTILNAARALADVTTISGSGFSSALGGITLDAGANIGIAGDTDLIDLTANTVTVNGAVSGSGNGQFGGTLQAGLGLFAVDADGDTTVKSLNAANGGITNAGSIAGATTITATGVVSSSDDGRFLALDINGTERISSAGNVSAVGLTGSGDLQVGGTVSLDGVVETAVQKGENQDGLYFRDSSDDNKVKFIDIKDFVDGLAGSGLSALNGVLSTDAGTVTEVIFSTTALSEGYNFYTGSASKALNLPGSPSVGDVVYVKVEDLGDGNAFTVNRSGSQLIDGETSVLLESDFAAVGFVYLAVNKWGII